MKGKKGYIKKTTTAIIAHFHLGRGEGARQHLRQTPPPRGWVGDNSADTNKVAEGNRGGNAERKSRRTTKKRKQKK